jgi:hypothetical protein
LKFFFLVQFLTLYILLWLFNHYYYTYTWMSKYMTRCLLFACLLHSCDRVTSPDKKMLILQMHPCFKVTLLFRCFFWDFGLSLQIPTGSSHTNYWLLYTFKVRNIVFLDFFFVLIWCFDNFFRILGWTCKLRRVAPIRIFGLFLFQLVDLVFR